MFSGQFWAIVVDGPKFKKVEYWPGEFPDEMMGPGYDFLTMGWEVHSLERGRIFVPNSLLKGFPDDEPVKTHPLVNTPHTCDIVGQCTLTHALPRR